MAKTNLIITSGLYDMTTLSLDEIIDNCITESIENNPRNALPMAAKTPLMYTPTKHKQRKWDRMPLTF